MSGDKEGNNETLTREWGCDVCLNPRVKFPTREEAAKHEEECQQKQQQQPVLVDFALPKSEEEEDEKEISPGPAGIDSSKEDLPQATPDKATLSPTLTNDESYSSDESEEYVEDLRELLSGVMNSMNNNEIESSGMGAVLDKAGYGLMDMEEEISRYASTLFLSLRTTCLLPAIDTVRRLLDLHTPQH